jgi:hypothetical protein
MGFDVDVQLDSLLPQARAWDEQSSAMGNIVAEINASQLSNATSIVTSQGGEVIPGVGISEDYPLFSSALSAYKQVSGDISRLCGQGQQMMERIADALTMAHRNYETTEAANIQSANNVGQ